MNYTEEESEGTEEGGKGALFAAREECIYIIIIILYIINVIIKGALAAKRGPANC